MNTAVSPTQYDNPTSHQGVELLPTRVDDRAAERAANLGNSLKHRWWYYAFVTVLAGFAGYFAAKEFGSYAYVAETQVRVTDLPYPPGTRYLEPPNISDFHRYLTHPEIHLQLSEDFGISAPPIGESLVDDEFDRKTELLTISVGQSTPEGAADLINRIVGSAIEKSTQDRIEFLHTSLAFYNSLIGEAEADAASKRQAKVDRVESLRDQYSIAPDEELEFEEVSELIRSQRERITTMELELADSSRLEAILEADEKRIVDEIKADLVEEIRQDLAIASQTYNADSPQAKKLEKRREDLAALGEQELNTIDQLEGVIREAGKILQTDLQIPDDDQPMIDRLREQQYQLTNRKRLLPQAIADAKRALASMRERRSGMEIAKLIDLENSPELLELTAEIELAENKVATLTSAIDWVRGMLALEHPAFEQVSVAKAELAAPDGNHKKIFVGVFGLVGLLLGVPVLLHDVFRSNISPSGRLGQEFGLPTMSAQEFQGRSFKGSALQPHDPELRLLANRIQKSAREARGSVVLFSSLSDQLSTDELTTTIAGCLAAREEKVLIIDLESIDDHRPNPQRAKRLTSQNANNGKKGNAKEKSTDVNLTKAAHKVGLAAALSGATRDVDDVLIARDESGVDRLSLGDHELPVEAFASPLMSRLLDRYRNDYSLVLLSGPPAKNLADLQVLSGKCDGTLFVAPSRSQIPAVAHRTIDDLVHHNVPIMGIVEVPS